MMLKNSPPLNRHTTSEPGCLHPRARGPSERADEGIHARKATGCFRAASCGLLAMACLLAAVQAPAAQPGESAAESQQKFIRLLQSPAAPGEKAMACKRLAVCGTAEAVPALAPLLSDPALASWARIALEAIPGPAADEALRQAMPKLQGRLLVGTINSLGVRRDPKALAALAAKLGDADAEVASAAAVALGRIGGERAAQALEQSLAKAPEAVRPAVAEGCIRCAEGFLNQGKAADAARLYDTVRQAKVPRQKLLEATRGAILARNAAGLPLLLEQLRSPDKARFSIGLRTARELAGPEVTRALADELWKTGPERQPYLLLALADRGETQALPTVLEAAARGPQRLRLVAVGILDRYGNLSSVPALLQTAAAGDAQLASAALAALARLPGNELDADLLARLPQSTGKMRQVLIELAAQRRIEGALPAIVPCAEDSDAGIRSAAVRAVGAIGQERHLADLTRLLARTEAPKERADIEAALLAISGRQGASSVQHLLPLAQNGDPALRVIALHDLAAAGGPEALAAVRAALEDQDESVQDEAARTLSTWPNTWPEDDRVAEPLLALARSGKKTSHQVLALRGCLQFLQGDKKLPNAEKTARLKELLPLIKRPEEKRLAIAVLHAIPNAEALDLLTNFAAEPAVAEDACSALLDAAASNTPGLSKEQRQKALQAVLANSNNDATRKKAQEALNRIR